MPSTARSTFLTQLVAYSDAVQADHLLKSSPPEAIKDETARLYRNGLTVVGFAVLEDFVRQRCEELVDHINLGPASFAELPKTMRTAASEGVLSTLLAQVRLLKRNESDPLDLIQTTGLSLASTKGSTLSMSRLALLWDGSNLGSDDFKNLMKTLGVKDSWSKMSTLCRRAGFGVQDARATFEELQAGRHRAAHKADYDSSVLSIRSLPSAASAIGFAFDALASRAANLCFLADPDYLKDDFDLESDDIGLRFLDDRGGKWAERRETALRAYRIHETLQSAKLAAMSRVPAGQVLVIRDRTGVPSEWISGDLP